MLYFSNRQIIFDFEIGTENEYIAPSTPFCDNKFVNNFMRNTKISKNINLNNLNANVICALPPNQIYKLVKEWAANCNFEKLYNWTIDDWFKEYISLFKKAAKEIGDEWNSDKSVFPIRKIMLAEELKNNYSDTKLAIETNKETMPEFSWCVEDCLSHMLKGTKSEYEKYVNNIIQHNSIRNIEYEKAMAFNGLFIHKKFKEIQTLKELDLNDIDKAMLYIHSPFPAERIRTNTVHIRKALHEYNRIKTQRN